MSIDTILYVILAVICIATGLLIYAGLGMLTTARLLRRRRRLL